jgi:hypothetical protein
MSHEPQESIFPDSPESENPLIKVLFMGAGRAGVKLELRSQGRDLLLLVTGGKAHVGAVGVWDGPNRGPESVVMELPGHREGPLAGECAQTLGLTSGKSVAAVVGIHQDHATPAEIAAIVEGVRQGVGELASFLASGKDDDDDR